MRIRTLLRLGLLQAAWILVSAVAWAQDLTRVEANVTSVSSGTVFLDRGLDAGIRVDDAVTIFTASGFTTDGRVRSVTRTSARLELLPGAATPNIGDRVEIMIPSERLKPLADGEHQPWESQNPAWDPNRPLLSPAFGTAPEERESVTSGQAYLRLSGTFDQQSGGRNYLLTSLGLDLRRTNPFGHGGEFSMSAEGYRRTSQLPNAPDENTDDFSLRRFSYRVGGEEDNPTRWEFGRFLQHEFPELGLIDGVEWSDKTSTGSTYGASFGAMPEPFPKLSSGDDIQAAMYYRWSADREHKLTYGAVYQNTWHKGNQDRNLFVGTLDWIASKVFSLHTVAWIDYYGPGDTVKHDGFELTEFTASGSWRTSERSSVNINASSRRYPELLRSEFVSLSPDQLLHDHIERIGAGWSSMIGTNTRTSARADFWKDQDDSGENYDASLGWKDLLWDRGELTLTGYYTDGTYSSGPGGRVSATKAWDDAFGTLMYSFTNYDQKSFAGTTATVAHQSIFASVDMALGKAWDLSIYVDDRFGDNLDTWDVGLSLQLRF
ncbi:MAG: hypothetical protein IPJ19_17190 [Planctomycetes bacterium]|nr:hypothetical protein [Planctomycetota bacterium]